VDWRWSAQDGDRARGARPRRADCRGDATRRRDADHFDLGWSPLFNSLPVIGDELLEPGPAGVYKMRWVDAPSLEISISEQLYEPPGDGLVRLHSRELHGGHPVR
jgi:hypothetical protein